MDEEKELMDVEVGGEVQQRVVYNRLPDGRMEPETHEGELVLWTLGSRTPKIIKA